MPVEMLASHITVAQLAKNKPAKNTDEAAATSPKQYAVRLPQPFVPRVEDVAETLGLDEAVLLRMIVVENLPAYERRAERVKAGLPPTE